MLYFAINLTISVILWGVVFKNRNPIKRLLFNNFLFDKHVVGFGELLSEKHPEKITHLTLWNFKKFIKDIPLGKQPYRPPNHDKACSEIITKMDEEPYTIQKQFKEEPENIEEDEDKGKYYKSNFINKKTYKTYENYDVFKKLKELKCVKFSNTDNKELRINIDNFMNCILNENKNIESVLLDGFVFRDLKFLRNKLYLNKLTFLNCELADGEEITMKKIKCENCKIEEIKILVY